jgi:ABC-type uncharacterized transport system ATPase subunit
MNKGKLALYGTMEDIRSETQLGATLIVRFNNAISKDGFPLSDAIKHVEQPDEKSLVFTLSPSCNVPGLLQEVLSTHDVETIQTQQPSLHDIYLNSVKGAE